MHITIAMGSIYIIVIPRMHIRTNCTMLHSSVQFISAIPTVSSLGTGKSVTGAHIAYAFAMLNRQRRKPSSSVEGRRPLLSCVLYCGPSNVAVDVIVSK